MLLCVVIANGTAVRSNPGSTTNVQLNDRDDVVSYLHQFASDLNDFGIIYRTYLTDEPDYEKYYRYVKSIEYIIDGIYEENYKKYQRAIDRHLKEIEGARTVFEDNYDQASFDSVIVTFVNLFKDVIKVREEASDPIFLPSTSTTSPQTIDV